MPPKPSSTVQEAAQTAVDQAPVLLEPEWALALLVGALGLSLAISYLAKLPGLRRVRHWLLLTRALAWAVVIFDVVFSLSRAVTEQYWVLLGVLVLGLMSVAGLDWLRNVIAGLALEFERKFHPGDLVRYTDIEGELAELSTRAVTLRAANGSVHQIPNKSFTDASVTHLEAEGEAACDIVVTLPGGVSPDRAVNLARQAAFLSPLASPRHRPDVFLDVAGGEDGAIELRIRGYAFDPVRRAHFRSDVVARVHEALRTEQALCASNQ